MASNYIYESGVAGAMKSIPACKIALPQHTPGRWLYPAVIKKNKSLDKRYGVNQMRGQQRDERVRALETK